MKAHFARNALAATALLALSPSAAFAQEDVKERVQDLAEQANEVQQSAGELANEVANAQDTRDGEAARAGDTDADGNRAEAREGRDHDGDGFDWGLLGLLGLAGLLGLKRRDDRVHTDTRGDSRL
jgi:opacity protein-like surface antigen